MKLLEKNPYLNREELAKKIGLSSDVVKHKITELKRKKALKRIGPNKGGYWKVLKSKPKK